MGPWPGKARQAGGGVGGRGRKGGVAAEEPEEAPALPRQQGRATGVNAIPLVRARWRRRGTTGAEVAVEVVLSAAAAMVP